LTVTGRMTIDAGSHGRLFLNGYAWTMTGAVLNNRGEIYLFGSEALTGVVNNTDAGLWEYLGGNGDGVTDTWTLFSAYHDLDIESSSDWDGGAQDNFQFPHGAQVNITGDFTMFEGTFDANASTATFGGFLYLQSEYASPVYIASSGSTTVKGDL